MVAVGLLYPGHSAEDDYPALEARLDGSIRLPVVIGLGRRGRGTLAADRVVAMVKAADHPDAEAILVPERPRTRWRLSTIWRRRSASQCSPRTR